MIIPRLTLAFLGGAWLAACAIVTAGWNLRADGHDAFMSAAVFSSPDSIFDRGIRLFRATASSPEGSLADKIESAARYDPIAEEPLMFAALRLGTASRQDEGIALLEEARRRNPRSRETRIVLLDRYLRSGKFGEATREIAVLNGLLPQDREKLASLLSYLVAMPESRNQSVAAVRESPLRRSLMTNLAQAGASSYLLSDISSDLKGIGVEDPDAPWASSLSLLMVHNGDIQGAARLWSHLFQTSQTKPGNRVVDDSFEGHAPPPFGWALSSDGEGRAMFSNAGLRVSYSGRKSTTLARQLLMLPPGRYRLSYKAVATEEEMPNLAWRIECAGKGGRLLDLPFVSDYSFESETDDGFEVPPRECAGQWLSLAGRPGQFPSSQSVDLRQVLVNAIAPK